jgi:hypothetical protein
MIRDALFRLAPFSDAQLAEILRCIRSRPVGKDARLLTEGQVCDTFFFVESDGLRHYAVLDWIVLVAQALLRSPSDA